MEPYIWESIPDTTNAEEAQHWKLYCMQGRDHLFKDGLYGLKAISNVARELYEATEVGAIIRWGRTNRWTHANRQSRHQDTVKVTGDESIDAGTDLLDKNVSVSKLSKKKSTEKPFKYVCDSRPPDNYTSLGITKPSKNSVSFTLNLGDLPSFLWGDNSCWLDSSLQLLFQALHGVGENFRTAANGELDSLPFVGLYDLFKLWERLLRGKKTSESIDKLTAARDDFRMLLVESKNPRASEKGQCTLWGWFDHIIQKKIEGSERYLAKGYFNALELTIEECRGATGINHLRVPKSPRQLGTSIVTMHDFQTYNGNLLGWLRSHTNFSEWHDTPKCRKRNWKDNSCQGTNISHDIWVSIPVVLIVDVEPNSLEDDWVFPQSMSIIPDVKYEMVGRIFFSPTHHHFVCRYSDIQGKKVYHYDGVGSGISKELSDTTLMEALWSRNITPPKGYRTSSVVYRLRGGKKNQQIYIKQAAEVLKRRFGIVMDGPRSLKRPLSIHYKGTELKLVKDNDRTWATKKDKETTNEYQSIDVPLDANATVEAVLSTMNKEPPHHDVDVGSIDETNTSNSFQVSESGSDLYDQDGPFRCRCGIERIGKGEEPVEEGSPEILCSECNMWMHQACQREGRASFIESDDFICDGCTLPLSFMESNLPPVELPSNWYGNDIIERLIPGRGCLIQIDEFWYPGRITQVKGTRRRPNMVVVRLWRLCTVADPSKIPNSSLVTVKPKSVVDDLWGDVKARRKIRLGKWIRSFEMEDEDDIVLSYRNVKVPKALDRILRPHISILERLMHLNYAEITVDDIKQVPALAYVHGFGSTLRPGLVDKHGDLPAIKRAEICNWFSENVPGGKNPTNWFGLVPYAHAIMLVIAEEYKYLLQDAWVFQEAAKKPNGIDVDLECLKAFEQRLFENSPNAGRAGTEVWGLDCGYHQDNWDPYANIPEEWKLNAITALDEDLTQGPHYIEFPRAPTPPKKQRPKPRPLKPVKTTNVQAETHTLRPRKNK